MSDPMRVQKIGASDQAIVTGEDPRPRALRAPKPCKDCVAEGGGIKRPIALDKDGRPVPGPRCATHHRAERKRLARQAAERRVEKVYAMPPEVYAQILEYQGGVCPICRIANGRTKRLAVEHAHGLEGCTHPPEQGCPKCWRGITCGRCNELVARFSPEALLRALQYLANPPAQRFYRGL